MRLKSAAACLFGLFSTCQGSQQYLNATSTNTGLNSALALYSSNGEYGVSFLYYYGSGYQFSLIDIPSNYVRWRNTRAADISPSVFYLQPYALQFFYSPSSSYANLYTWSSPVAFMGIQDDGILALYDSAGTPIYSLMGNTVYNYGDEKKFTPWQIFGITISCIFGFFLVCACLFPLLPDKYKGKTAQSPASGYNANQQPAYIPQQGGYPPPQGYVPQQQYGQQPYGQYGQQPMYVPQQPGQYVPQYVPQQQYAPQQQYVPQKGVEMTGV